jgi:AcrR family transcriptional regulator
MSEPLSPDHILSEAAEAAKAEPKAPVDKRRQAIEALMRLASDRPWSDIEITDVAQEAGLTLSEMRDLFPSKGAMLDGFTRMIDKIVIEGTSDDLIGEPARERIFDVVMRRLDAMTPYKAALRRISFAVRGDLASLAALNRVGLNSARYMLAAAGVPTEGPLGAVKLQGFVLAQANILSTWFEDDDPTAARTMARLDKELGRGERVLERAEDFRRLTAPLRALGQALLDGRDRVRRRSSSRDDLSRDLDGDHPAAAI